MCQCCPNEDLKETFEDIFCCHAGVKGRRAGAWDAPDLFWVNFRYVGSLPGYNV